MPCLSIAQTGRAIVMQSENEILKSESACPERLSYRCPAPQFNESTDPSGNYCRIALPGHHYTTTVGEPELPVFSRIIEVPEGMSINAAISEVSTTELRLSDNRMR